MIFFTCSYIFSDRMKKQIETDKSAKGAKVYDRNVKKLWRTVLSANMATSVAKHKVKHEVKHETKDMKHDMKKETDLDIDKKVKKGKRKMKRKAVKAVL